MLATSYTEPRHSRVGAEPPRACGQSATNAGRPRMTRRSPPGDLAIDLTPTHIEIEAVVVRADGSREDLGVIAYWHRNPLRRAWWRLTRALASHLGVAPKARR
jgi:hypothetical protein